MMKQPEESRHLPDNAPTNSAPSKAKNNQQRTPTNIKDEMFNSNDLLKQIMKDCIDEGM